MTRANQRLDELLGELGQLPAELRVNYVVKQLAKLIDDAEVARAALRGLYDECEERRQRRQESGLKEIARCRELLIASTLHPSQWAPTPAMLIAEEVLNQKGSK